jgi:DNA helicase HerA-like ATPase
MPVIGRTDDRGPTCRIGRYRARDGSSGAPVEVDLDRPHVVLVVGKRGSGKSYTLGVLAEALARTAGVGTAVADPMAAFHGLATLEGAATVDPRIPAGGVPSQAWCSLLGLDPASGAGSLVWRAAEEASTLSGMVEVVVAADVPDRTRRAARNHLRLAESWGVFDDGRGPTLDGSETTVLDLAGIDRAPTNAIVAAVARRLYDRRIAGDLSVLPWLLVDEAHVAFDGVAGPALRQLATRGRQPGVSLVAATQRPSALPDVAVSQADLLVVHRLTSGADRETLARACPSYFAGSLAERMPAGTGEALLVDDATESVHRIDVRERTTPHGGESPRVSG